MLILLLALLVLLLSLLVKLALIIWPHLVRTVLALILKLAWLIRSHLILLWSHLVGAKLALVLEIELLVLALVKLAWLAHGRPGLAGHGLELSQCALIHWLLLHHLAFLSQSLEFSEVLLHALGQAQINGVGRRGQSSGKGESD